MTIKYFLGHLFVMLFVACAQAQSKYEEQTSLPFTFVSKIDAKTADSLEFEQGGKVYIVSGGGELPAALKIAEKIVASESDVSIPGFCLSACAEFFVGSRPTVATTGRTLIGFHHNLMLLNKWAKGDTRFSQCYAKEAEEHRTFLRLRGISTSFVTQLERRLGFIRVETNQASSCEDLNFVYQNSYWFPTSEQLTEYFGTEFSHPICNDTIECVERNARGFFEDKAQIFIGNRRFYWSGTDPSDRHLIEVPAHTSLPQ